MIKTITLCNVCGKETTNSSHISCKDLLTEDEYSFDICTDCNPWDFSQFAIPVKLYNCNEW